jgi:hypothetical protein
MDPKQSSTGRLTAMSVGPVPYETDSQPLKIAASKTARCLDRSLKVFRTADAAAASMPIGLSTPSTNGGGK